MDRVEVCRFHEFHITMGNSCEPLGEAGCLEIDHVLTPRGYHLVLSQEEGILLEVTGSDFAGK